jgi:hypothetical protein
MISFFCHCEERGNPEETNALDSFAIARNDNNIIFHPFPISPCNDINYLAFLSFFI